MVRCWLLLVAAGVAVTACSSGQTSLARSPSRHVTTGARLGIHSPVPDDWPFVVPGKGADSGTGPAALGVTSGFAGSATLPHETYPSQAINVSTLPPPPHM